jgi:hypothetical protein
MNHDPLTISAKRRSLLKALAEFISMASIDIRKEAINRLVREACIQHKVPLPAIVPLKQTSSLRVIALLLKGESQIAISKEIGISPQRVFQLKKEAEKAGLVFPFSI